MARILLIDDDDVVRALLHQVLTERGHTVIAASDGDEGLKLFPTAQADLLITDIVMPVKSGLEVLKELRDSRTPFKAIAISGGSRHGDDDGLRRATALGAAKVLAKPFTSGVLMAAVDEVLAVGGSESRRPTD